MATGGGLLGFVITRWHATWLSLAVIVVLVVLAHFAIRGGQEPGDAVAERRRGVKALVIGADGRTSTSKVQAVLWTFAVLYALLFLLMVGRSFHCGGGASCVHPAISEAFRNQVDRGLQPAYYVLLGFPLGVALAAKALTTNKVASGDLVKPPIADDGDHAGPIGDILANDNGEADLVDSQYFAFNVLTLAFFFVEFLGHPVRGLPDIPPTLLALSGVAAAVYTTKKALETSFGPVITAVVQSPAAGDAERLVVVGSGFGPSEGAQAKVLVGGHQAVVESWTDLAIVATVTADVTAALAASTPTASVDVVVTTDDCVDSDPFHVTV